MFVLLSYLSSPLLLSSPSEGGVGGILGFIFGSFLSLKERVPFSVSDVEAPGIAVCKAMRAIDYILWKG